MKQKNLLKKKNISFEIILPGKRKILKKNLIHKTSSEKKMPKIDKFCPL